VMQEKIAALKASMPANKQVLADKYAASFDGGKVFADALSYAHIKPSSKGYNEFTSTLQTEIETNVFNDKKMTAKQALDEVAPKLEAILKGGQ
jgi:maltose-binding protein MalE